jgi:hypothetical protein
MYPADDRLACGVWYAGSDIDRLITHSDHGQHANE